MTSDNYKLSQPKTRQSIMSTTAACWALLTSLAIVMLSSGLQGTLIGLRAIFEGFETDTTGFVMSGYFAGFAAGSLLAPSLVHSVGHVRVFAALASLASVVPLLHGMIIDPYFWFSGRVVTGFSYAGIFIVTESWLNDRATNQTRGTLLSVYMMTTAGAMALGPLLLNLSTPLALDLFILASVLVSLALIPILLAASPAPSIVRIEKMRIPALFRLSPLGVVGITCTGMSNGALLGMGAVYADALNFSVTEVSIFISLIFIGGVIFQFPIGIISDYFDRRLVIMAVTTLAGVIPVILIFTPFSSPEELMIAFTLFGGLSLPLYSLCATHANDHLSTTQMVAAGSALVLAAGVGATLGPLIASFAMNAIGTQGFLWYFGCVHIGIGLYAFYRMTRRTALPNEEQGNITFTPQPATVSPIFDPGTIREIAEGNDIP